MNWLAIAGLTLTAYLLSAFPSGVVWGRFIKGVDVRKFGSGKTGATNSLRALGWQVSLLVFLTDMAKGAVSVGLPLLLSDWFQTSTDNYTPWVVLSCGMASVIGHNHSVFINLQGGRGVATGVGQVFVVSPLTMLMVIPLDLLIIWYSRYVSLGSILGGVLTAGFLVVNVWWFGLDPRYLVWGFAMTGYIIYSHYDNIIRLINGTERKLGDDVKPVSSDGEDK